MRGPVSGWRTHVLSALAAVAFGLAFAIFLAHGAGALPHLGGADYEVRALMPDVSGLAQQSRVTEAGVDIGRVKSIRRDGNAVLVTMSIDDAHAPVPTDSRAQLRQRTLIGEKYIELQPGHAKSTLPTDGVIPLDRAPSFVEVDQILSQLRGRTRQRARDVIQRLGGALNGTGDQLNRLLHNTSGLITTGTPVVGELAKDRLHITGLVSNLGDIAAQISERDEALRSFASGTASTFRALAAKDQALGATLREFPATLNQLRRTAGTLQSTSTTATPVVARLSTALRGLQPTFSLLGPAARQGQQVISNLGAAAPRLQTTLAALRRLSPPAVRTLPQVTATLCQANPAIAYLAPYRRELLAMITSLGSAVNAYDAVGHTSRLDIGISTDSALAEPPAIQQAQNQLVNVGLLSQVRVLGYDPYPPAGEANNLQIGAGSVGPADAVHNFTRVHADC